MTATIVTTQTPLPATASSTNSERHPAGESYDSAVETDSAPINSADDDDLAWARPRPTASTRLKASVGALAFLLAATIGFAAGAKYGRSHAPAAASSGRNGFGRGAGGGGGFGGGGGGGGGGSGAAGAAASPSGTPAPAAGLGALLPK